jgi:hypothetical protein
LAVENNKRITTLNNLSLRLCAFAVKNNKRITILKNFSLRLCVFALTKCQNKQIHYFTNLPIHGLKIISLQKIKGVILWDEERKDYQ